MSKVEVQCRVCDERMPCVVPVMRIELGAIIGNWRRIQRFVGAHVKVAAVVKSDAYGLGMVPVSDALSDAGCDWFITASIHEAIRLRQRQPECRISVLQPHIDDSIAQFKLFSLEPIIGNWTILKRWLAQGGLTEIAIHVDTGMRRCSISYEDIGEIRLLLRKHGISVSLCISHLAEADNPTSPLNEIQRERFSHVISCLKPRCASLSASAGTLLGRRFCYDAVRIGSHLFGDNVRVGLASFCTPVVTIRACVLDVLEISAGCALGYEQAEAGVRRRRIASVGVGYAHGLPVVLPGWFVIIKGMRACVTANASMENLFVDVTDLPSDSVLVGDPVDVVNSTLRLEQLARCVNRTPLDLLAPMCSLMERQYVAATPQGRLEFP